MALDEGELGVRNIGPKSFAWLTRVGVLSRDDLIAAGVVPTFLMVRQAGARPSLNLLWALEGAVRDQDWRTISSARRRQLKAELDRLTIQGSEC